MSDEANDVKWNEVFRLHRSFKAIALQNGRVTSILAGNLSHRDDLNDEVVEYSMPRTSGYAWMRKRMEEASKEGYGITVYRKRASNDWEDLEENSE